MLLSIDILPGSKAVDPWRLARGIETGLAVCSSWKVSVFKLKFWKINSFQHAISLPPFWLLASSSIIILADHHGLQPIQTDQLPSWPMSALFLNCLKNVLRAKTLKSNILYNGYNVWKIILGAIKDQIIIKKYFDFWASLSKWAKNCNFIYVFFSRYCFVLRFTF